MALPSLVEVADLSLTHEQLVAYLNRIGLELVETAQGPGVQPIKQGASPNVSQNDPTDLTTGLPEPANLIVLLKPPSLALLDLITRQHLRCIPFENFNVALLGQVKVHLLDIFASLVCQRRGGWCYQQNRLLAAVLLHLGYLVEFLESHVLMDDGVTPRVPHAPPRNHVLLAVRSESSDAAPSYLVDVGFGNSSPLGSLPLEPGAEGQLGTIRYQLRTHRWPPPLSATVTYELWGLDPSMAGWTRFYDFRRDAVITATDIVMANYYTCSNYTSQVMARKSVAMYRKGNCSYVLRGLTFVTTRYANGTAEKETVEVTSSRQLQQIARDAYGLQLTWLQARRVFLLNYTPDRRFEPMAVAMLPSLSVSVSASTLVGSVAVALSVGIGIGCLLRSKLS